MKISVVTPTFNSGKYLSETIISVLSQEGDFEIEYILVDNCSTDNTLDIIKQYERLVKEKSIELRCRKIDLRWSSQKDRGMYDAINKGFKGASGDIYAWINSDDIYLPGAFEAVRKAFSEFSEVKWLKGITSFMRESKEIKGRCYLYDRNWIKRGRYGKGAYFIEQDSVFWRTKLWGIVGGLDPELRLAGDYDLWIKFAKLTELYTLNYNLSMFRIRTGQLSSDMRAYYNECRRVSPSPNLIESKMLRVFFIFENRFIPKYLRPFFFKLLFGRLDFNLLEFKSDRCVLRKNDYYTI